MTDLKTHQTVSKKKLFSQTRSTSEPSSASVEPAGSDATQTKNTLRRSKSGRVKVMTRTRSLVSTYDFKNTHEAVVEEKVRDDPSSKKKDIDAEMLRRIARMWTEDNEEDVKSCKKAS